MLPRQRHTVGAHDPQVFTAPGGLGEHVAFGGDECQAVGDRLEGLHSVAADGMQAALAVEGEADRRLGGDIAGGVGAAGQQFDRPRSCLDATDRFGLGRLVAVSRVHEQHSSEERA